MRSRSSMWFTALALGLIAAGCRPKVETASASPRASSPTPAAATSRKVAQPPAIATARAPVDLLPEGTGVAVTAASVRHLLRVLDVAALIATYRPHYDQAAAYLEQSLGHNLLDPGRWPEIGVDPDGPLGGALLDAGSGTSCLFFTLNDPPRFRDFLDRMGAKIGGELEPVYEDRGVVLAHKPGARTSLVLRDDFAFLVMTGNPSLTPYDFARELASVDPARGLTASQRWRQAVGAAAGRDAVAFIDVGGMIRAEIAAQQRVSEASPPSWAEQELQRLRELGGAPEEIARWEQVADEQRAAEATHRERQRRAQEMWSAVFGPLGPIVVELSLGPQAIAGTARAQAPESALLRRLIEPSAAPPLAMTAASERVLFGTGGKLDVAESLAAVDGLLRADGNSLDALLERLKANLGGDVRAVLGLLDGAVSFAVTAKDVKALASPDGASGLGFNLALEVTDAAAAEELVTAMAATLPGLKVRRGKARGHVVSVPQWREVHVATVGSTLTFSTDPKFAQQVERAPGGPWAARPPAVTPIVTAPETAAVLMVDHAALLAMFLAERGRFERYEPWQNQPYWRFPSQPHATIEAVPQSPAYKARLKEWRRLDAKIERAEQAQQRRRTQQALAVAESLGTMALHLRETGDGLMTDGGQFFGPGGLARAIEQTVDGLSGETGADYSVHEQRGRVEQEMLEIRVRDIERALGVRAAE